VASRVPSWTSAGRPRAPQGRQPVKNSR
jgi:hypothetical protein